VDGKITDADIDDIADDFFDFVVLDKDTIEKAISNSKGKPKDTKKM